MPDQGIVIERGSAGCLRLLLARPDPRNALVPGMVAALTEAMRSDPAAVVVLASTDPQVFCAGADLGLPDPGRSCEPNGPRTVPPGTRSSAASSSIVGTLLS